MDRSLLWAGLALALGAAGCRSPYYADRGAVLGGATGAGVGALVGDATGGSPVAGALIGGAVGALTGAAVGDSIDADVARSQAEIQARMGRQMAGAVRFDDVVAMTRAGLNEEVIATHIRANGVATPPTVNDLIYLRNQGVSDRVIQALQQTPPPQPTYIAAPPPRQVIVHEYAPWGPPPPPYWSWHYQRGYCPPRHVHGHGHSPRVSWGFSFGR